VPRSGKLSLRPLPPPRDRLLIAIPCESVAVVPTTVVSVAPAAIADDAVVSAALLALISRDPRPSGGVSFAIGIARVPSLTPLPRGREWRQRGRTENSWVGCARIRSRAGRRRGGRTASCACALRVRLHADSDVALMRSDPCCAPVEWTPVARNPVVRTQPAVVCCVRAVPGACSVRVMGSRVQAGSRDLHSCKMRVYTLQ
jgi:hypothetical protein